MNILERLSIRVADQSHVLQSLIACHHINEALLLSTCNRKELYLDVVGEPGGVYDVISLYATYTGLDRSVLEDTLHVKSEIDAANHLYRVAAGLESMVVGERQILMQIRQAFAQSLDAQVSGPTLNKVLRTAINLGRTIRQETALGLGASSTVSVALNAAIPHLPPKPNILIIGAGHIGGMVARTLAGIDQLTTPADPTPADEPALPAVSPGAFTIVNRTLAKAEELATRLADGGMTAIAIPLTVENIARALPDVDLVVTSTDANYPLLTKDIMEIILPHRSRPQTVLVDMAVPRDIDPGVAGLDGIVHIDIEALRDLVVGGPTKEAIGEAEAHIAAKTKEFASWLQGVSAEPTVKALQQHGEEVRQRELQRNAKKLASLSPEQRNAVEALTKGIVKTLLHQPSITLKQQGSTQAGRRYAQAVGALFDLTIDPEEQS